MWCKMHELLIFVCTGVEKLPSKAFTQKSQTHPRFSNLSTFDFECLPMKLAKCDLFPAASWAIVEFEQRTSSEAFHRG
jgi:hypothetical protein